METELYARIKARREELGLSQDELAARMGYKDRSTIAKIEAGVNDITQSKIKAFADALHTSTAWLMGWDSNAVGVPAVVSFGPVRWNELDQADQQRVEDFITALLSAEKYSSKEGAAENLG